MSVLDPATQHHVRQAAEALADEFAGVYSRETIERLAATERSADAVVRRLATEIRPSAERFNDGLRSGTYDGQLEASTAARLTSMLLRCQISNAQTTEMMRWPNHRIDVHFDQVRQVASP